MSVHSFVAHFLKENGYLETLKAFETEHGNIIRSDLPHEETLESIIADRLRYLDIDEKKVPEFEGVLHQNLQKIKENQFKQWSAPYPKNMSELGPVSELIVDSAILSTEKGGQYALLATSTRSLVIIDLDTQKEVARIRAVIGNVVIRRIAVEAELIFLCGMNGCVSIGRLSSDLQNFETLSQTQIHPRLVTDIKIVNWHDKLHLVSMGWDFYVKVHEIQESGAKMIPVGQPFKLANQGSCFDAVIYQEKLYVLVCKREITLMDVICMDTDKKNMYLDCRVALNDAEFSASGFTPMCVKIYAGNQGNVPLVAVGTSHEPHTRVIIVSMQEVGQKDDQLILRNQILCNLNTSSPQDKFSDAEIQWRYAGSGIWVIGDDGVIHGLDIVNKSVDVKLEGHDGRIKSVAFYKDKLVSCGTDRKVIKWW